MISIRLFGVFILLMLSNAPLAELPPPEYIQFSPTATMGAIYFPDPEVHPEPHIAIVNMHRTENRLAHISMREMASRGFVILGMNPRCQNNEAKCAPWENNALDVKQGVEYVRDIPGIETVILMGGSGGGPTMSFYQAVAENGIEFCQQEHKLTKCPDTLVNLPSADGIVFRDAHLGNGANALRSLSPAVTNDAEIMATNAEPKLPVPPVTRMSRLASGLVIVPLIPPCRPVSRSRHGGAILPSPPQHRRRSPADHYPVAATPSPAVPGSVWPHPS